MSTLHPIMTEALGGFRPPPAPPDPTPHVYAEQRVIYLQNQLNRLLRTPFMLEVQTHDAITHLAPEDCTGAEYVEIIVPPQRVAQAVEKLIEDHMPELESILKQIISQEAKS
jgi:hypothetical protein